MVPTTRNLLAPPTPATGTRPSAITMLTLSWLLPHEPYYANYIYCMMTSSYGNIFRVTGPLCGEFTGDRWQWPVTRSFDVLFDLRLNKRLSKQSGGWWFETSSHPLWRHCNGAGIKQTIEVRGWLTRCFFVIPGLSSHNNLEILKVSRYDIGRATKVLTGNVEINSRNWIFEQALHLWSKQGVQRTTTPLSP